jgi:YgiT-type zinc finger domain-containing protein
MKNNNVCYCENLFKIKVTESIRVNGYQIEVKDAPARVCVDCGEVHINATYLLDLVEKDKASKKKPL